jgi:hypothetical protein
VQPLKDISKPTESKPRRIVRACWGDSRFSSEITMTSYTYPRENGIIGTSIIDGKVSLALH